MGDLDDNQIPHPSSLKGFTLRYDENWQGWVSDTVAWGDVSRMRESCEHHGVPLPGPIRAVVESLSSGDPALYKEPHDAR